MHITSKSRYAIKIMLDIAKHDGEGVVRRKEIATRQGVPLEYLDQILSRLRKAGLLFSTRGPNGGYQLAKTFRQITAWEIFAAVEDYIFPVICLNPEAHCQHEHICETQGAWEKIFQSIYQPLNSLKLSDLMASPKSSLHIDPTINTMICSAGSAMHG